MNPIERKGWLAKEILVHERALRGYLSRFFKNVADVEDVVQETYARLLSSPGQSGKGRAGGAGWGRRGLLQQ
jgi:DNA-directed RNA polymerase specialized sigma24 family protein